MNRYPHDRRQPFIAVAAAVASAATLALTVVLPATYTAQPALDAGVAVARDANPWATPVSLGRIEVVAQRPVPLVKASNVTPTAMESAKQPCPPQRGDPA